MHLHSHNVNFGSRTRMLLQLQVQQPAAVWVVDWSINEAGTDGVHSTYIANVMLQLHCQLTVQSNKQITNNTAGLNYFRCDMQRKISSFKLGQTNVQPDPIIWTELLALLHRLWSAYSTKVNMSSKWVDLTFVRALPDKEQMSINCCRRNVQFCTV